MENELEKHMRELWTQVFMGMSGLVGAALTAQFPVHMAARLAQQLAAKEAGVRLVVQTHPEFYECRLIEPGGKERVLFTTEIITSGRLN